MVLGNIITRVRDRQTFLEGKRDCGLKTAMKDTRAPPISKPAGLTGVNTGTREGPCRESRTLWAFQLEQEGERGVQRND